MNAPVVSDILQEAVDGADYAALASDVARCARVAGGIFGGHQNSVADFVFARRGFHNCFQSARTLGASATVPGFSASLCCDGSSA